MDRGEFEAYLMARDEWDFAEAEGGLTVMWWKAGETDDPTTMHHIADFAILGNTIETLLAACKSGCDVDHVTRVTGYFSKVSGWNKGKKQELLDRHRTRFGKEAT